MMNVGTDCHKTMNMRLGFAFINRGHPWIKQNIMEIFFIGFFLEALSQLCDATSTVQ